MRASTQTRDGSLRRLRLVNRWMLIGSVVLTAMLTVVVSHAFPSKASASRPSTGAGGRKHPRRATHHATAHRSHAPKPLQPAAQPPAASSRPEPATAEEPRGPSSAEVPAPSEEAHEATPPAQEAAPEPVHEAAPAEEAAAPVVSGGS